MGNSPLPVISNDIKAKLIEEFIGQDLETLKSPKLYSMAGIPASGKTTFLKQQLSQHRLVFPHYYHNPDHVMEALPGYRSDLNTHGAQIAMRNWQNVARTFSDETLFKRALKNNYNIIMDMGFARPEILAMVEHCKQSGYSIHITMIYCDLHEAYTRSECRTRYSAHEMINQRAEFLSKNFHLITELAHTTSFLDNSNSKEPFQNLSYKEAEEKFTNYKT